MLVAFPAVENLTPLDLQHCSNFRTALVYKRSKHYCTTHATFLRTSRRQCWPRLVRGARRKQKAAMNAASQVFEADKRVDRAFMRLALREAQKAGSRNEVPVGAVVVCGTEVVCKTHNEVEARSDPTQHAELLAIQNAAAKIGRFMLPKCTLYVTLEPCPMCAGALLQARMGRVTYGSRNTLLGADGSWISMLRATPPESQEAAQPTSNKRAHPFHPAMEVTGGVLSEESASLMKEFFRQQRIVKGAKAKNALSSIP